MCLPSTLGEDHGTGHSYFVENRTFLLCVDILEIGGTRWAVCGEARDAAKALEQDRQLKPESVISDLRMSRMSGTIAAKAIRRAAPNIKIMLLSVHDSEMLETLTPLIGADAWLSKSCSREAT